VSARATALPLPQTAAPETGARSRNGSADILRTGAAVIIVLFHARLPGSMFMMSAMGVFTVLLTYHARLQADRHGPGPAVAARAGRLLRPFAVWFCIYVAALLADAARTGQPLLASLSDWLPPNGTMHHLWFLPFAFVTATLASLVPGRDNADGGWGIAVSAPFAAATLAVAWASLGLPPPLRVWGNYLPAALLGLVLALMPAHRGPRMALALISAGLGLVLLWLGWPATQQFVISVPLVTVALITPIPSSPAIRRLADMSMAIYLVHPLMLAVALRVTGAPVGDVAAGLLTLAGSFAAAAVLCTLPAARRVL